MSRGAAAQSTPVLLLRKIGRQFGTEPAVHALVDVDLRLDEGEWLSITGPSGAGKSTLLNVIGCLDRPTTGKYFIDGINTSELSDKERAGLRSQRIGFVFQSFHLLPYRSVLENVMLAEVYRKAPCRGSCRVESDSASPSRGRSSVSRVSCSATSRPETSTPSRHVPFSISWGISMRKA